MNTGQTAPRDALIDQSIQEIQTFLEQGKVANAASALSNCNPNSAFAFTATTNLHLRVVARNDLNTPLLKIGTNGFGLYGIVGPYNRDGSDVSISIDTRNGGGISRHLATMLHGLAGTRDDEGNLDGKAVMAVEFGGLCAEADKGTLGVVNVPRPAMA